MTLYKDESNIMLVAIKLEMRPKQSQESRFRSQSSQDSIQFHFRGEKSQIADVIDKKPQVSAKAPCGLRAMKLRCDSPGWWSMKVLPIKFGLRFCKYYISMT